MSVKLTDSQLVLLGAAAQRKDLCLVAPPTLKGTTAQKVANKLISAGFIKEVNEPLRHCRRPYCLSHAAMAGSFSMAK